MKSNFGKFAIDTCESTVLSYEHVGSKIPAKINTHMLTRAELLITLCYEIPCTQNLCLNQTCNKKSREK